MASDGLNLVWRRKMDPLASSCGCVLYDHTWPTLFMTNTIPLFPVSQRKHWQSVFVSANRVCFLGSCQKIQK